MNPDDCEHIKIETCFQYDAQKNRTVFWLCPECHMLFQPKGLADAQLEADLAGFEKDNADLHGENEALRGYATHKPGCHEDGEDCICGLDAILEIKVGEDVLFTIKDDGRLDPPGTETPSAQLHIYDSRDAPLRAGGNDG